MLIYLSIGTWSARKLDKTATREVADNHNTTEAWGRYNKSLIDKAALEKITKISGEARAYHYTNTLPWDDNGGRILPSAHYLEYTSAMRDFKNRFDQETAVFVTNYTQLIDEARAHLNGLFKQEDYPDGHTISGKFTFSTDILPIPNAGDFRVTLTGTETDSIKKEIEDRTAGKINQAIKDLYDRLKDALTHVKEKCSSTDAIFRDSMIDNLKELVTIIPRLNITDDPGLVDLCQQAEAIAATAPDRIRNNETIRTETAQTAEEILKAMSGYVS
jgi:hypothetical protein